MSKKPTVLEQSIEALETVWEDNHIYVPDEYRERIRLYLKEMTAKLLLGPYNI